MCFQVQPTMKNIYIHSFNICIYIFFLFSGKIIFIVYRFFFCVHPSVVVSEQKLRLFFYHSASDYLFYSWLFRTIDELTFSTINSSAFQDKMTLKLTITQYRIHKLFLDFEFIVAVERASLHQCIVKYLKTSPLKHLKTKLNTKKQKKKKEKKDVQQTRE